MSWILNPRIFLIVTTALFGLGAIAYAAKREWAMAGYHACAAGLQLCVMAGGK
jgi:hypothetical protein